MKTLMFILLSFSVSIATANPWAVEYLIDKPENIQEDADGILYFIVNKSFKTYDNQLYEKIWITWSKDEGKTWQNSLLPANNSIDNNMIVWGTLEIFTSPGMSGFYYYNSSFRKLYRIRLNGSNLVSTEITTPRTNHTNELSNLDFKVSGNTIYAMNMHTELFRSDDEGKSWIEIGKNVPLSRPGINNYQVSSTGALIVHTNFPNEGLYVSSNGGTTFKFVPPPSAEVAKAPYAVNFFSGNNGTVWMIYNTDDSNCIPPFGRQVSRIFSSSGDLVTWMPITDWPTRGNIDGIHQNSAGDLVLSQPFPRILADDIDICPGDVDLDIVFSQFPGGQTQSRLTSILPAGSSKWVHYAGSSQTRGPDQVLLTEKRILFVTPRWWDLISPTNPAAPIPTFKGNLADF